MSYYNFKFTKGKFELEINSEDKIFVLSQFDKIQREMLDKKTPSAKVTAPSVEPVAEEPKEEAVKEPEAVVAEKEPEVEEEAVSAEPEVTAAKEKSGVSKEEPEVAEKTEEKLEETAEVTETVEAAETVEIAEVANDFQKIIEEKLKEEDDAQEVSGKEDDVKETITYYEETSEKEPDESDEETEVADTLRQSFDDEEVSKEKNTKVYDILQEKLSVLPEEERNKLNLGVTADSDKKKLPSELKFKGLDDLLYLKKPQTKLDYLLVAAYFLQENEDKEKYSLKHVNSKLVPQAQEPIDHSVIHEAIARSYFEVAPNATEASDITEYKITEEGVDYVLNEL